MLESRKVPQITVTAMALLKAKFNADVTMIGNQTLIALGLNPDDPWTVDFDAGTITREIPDEAPP